MTPAASSLNSLADRRVRLAAATNALLNGLRGGSVTAELVGTAGGIDDTAELGGDLTSLGTWCTSLGLARPAIPAEITDPDTGEALVYADAAWSEGMQAGRSEKVALVLERDEETESRLGELGYRFFTSRESLGHYVEELLNIDLDGDGHIGGSDDGPPSG